MHWQLSFPTGPRSNIAHRSASTRTDRPSCATGPVTYAPAGAPKMSKPVCSGASSPQRSVAPHGPHSRREGTPSPVFHSRQTVTSDDRQHFSPSRESGRRRWNPVSLARVPVISRNPPTDAGLSVCAYCSLKQCTSSGGETRSLDMSDPCERSSGASSQVVSSTPSFRRPTAYSTPSLSPRCVDGGPVVDPRADSSSHPKGGSGSAGQRSAVEAVRDNSSRPMGVFSG